MVMPFSQDRLEHGEMTQPSEVDAGHTGIFLQQVSRLCVAIERTCLEFADRDPDQQPRDVVGML